MVEARCVDNYRSVTVHLIDASWELHSFALAIILQCSASDYVMAEESMEKRPLLDRLSRECKGGGAREPGDMGDERGEQVDKKNLVYPL
ncbi:hypothetical protein PAMA_018503 [Pampus argenteus]